MTLRDDILPIAYEARAIAGDLGFREHRVYVVTSEYTGDYIGRGDELSEQVEITESGGQPPKARWLKDEEIALGDIGKGAVMIGPITPASGSVGTDVEGLMRPDANGQIKHIRIVGPKHPNGALYRVVDIDSGRALRRMIKAAPVVEQAE